jgi:hypothetical protein
LLALVSGGEQGQHRKGGESVRYAATGPADDYDLQRGYDVSQAIVHRALFGLPEGDKEFTTGAAFGIDTIVYYEAVSMYPEAFHRVCAPLGMKHNEDVLFTARRLGHEIIYVPGGYMKRNDELVAQCDVLLAFPRSAKEELRSGTWATIRRARKAGKEIRLFPLLG